MKKVFHPASSRGSVDFGWLKANYSFSFAKYYNPDYMQFGNLRVLNDDFIAGGKGFGMHSHQNMEIITIPLQGALQHKDSLGNEGVITKGEVQVMSAGSGVQHSEFNASQTETVNILQIWVFTEKENATPRYDQKKFSFKANKFLQIVSPKNDNDGNALWVYQQAYFNLGNFNASTNVTYKLHQQNHGIYILVISGKIEVSNQLLEKRDAIGIWDTSNIEIKVIEDAYILLIEVPMT
ncbi:hypothetical protein SAMN04488096_102275 [Mesonia phycicola]|uniref:Pirin N-terminal domain-containing protein n=1 Tax=Mesonia phycicola TaxID=579105 RepID=A0A1M6BYN2_9FLAO|nr:pirin family protein [Mesonia phycicola]SHI53691.1 hypothetical protein SAMN04488096_102275 [Mesonia phycicola]